MGKTTVTAIVNQKGGTAESMDINSDCVKIDGAPRGYVGEGENR